jgi:hypothetical protein
MTIVLVNHPAEVRKGLTRRLVKGRARRGRRSDRESAWCAVPAS